MTDKEIINGLIERDNNVTQYFIYKYRPLFLTAINIVFDYPVDRDECVNELYIYLLKDDATKLRSFEGRCTLGAWLKVVAIRFFLKLKKQNMVIEEDSKESPYEQQGVECLIDTTLGSEVKHDLEKLFSLMQNPRYVYVIREIVLNDKGPEKVAKSMGITVVNLYNIKKRAIASLTRVALIEKRRYEHK